MFKLLEFARLAKQSREEYIETYEQTKSMPKTEEISHIKELGSTTDPDTKQVMPLNKDDIITYFDDIDEIHSKAYKGYKFTMDTKPGFLFKLRNVHRYFDTCILDGFFEQEYSENHAPISNKTEPRV